MANTNALKKLVEPCGRRWCSLEYGIDFEDYEKEIGLLTGGRHKFDIVSKDGSVVAGIKTSAMRNNGKVSPMVIKSTYTELYFLSLVKASIKLMILTDENYYEHFRRISEGKIADGIEIIICPLSGEIRESVAVVHDNCRREIGKK